MFVIGTAGHVDHGKSTLVKALTGIDPDRLREEKEREMTIDLGFAWLRLPSEREVSIVDVPGHERFIKNMLAGVGGIDAAVLVIAADEGPMPQTREHLAILDLLQVRAGVVALTKRDMVDNEWLDLVKEEIADLLHGTALDGASIVPVSSKTGEGLPDLLAAVDTLLMGSTPRMDRGRPRLPIDRAFSIAGFGTVVTGTLIDGELKVGMEVEIQPSGLKSRVRTLQSHKHKAEVAGPGSRVAANLVGLQVEDLSRGDVLTVPGWLRPTKYIDVQVRVLKDSPMSLEQNDLVDLFVGSAETSARVSVLDTPAIEPGKEGWVQLRLADPVAAVKGDRFVIRQPSPSVTVGGGVIVEPHPRRHKRFQESVITALETLATGTPAEILLEALGDKSPVGLGALLEKSAVRNEDAPRAVEELRSSGQLIVLRTAALASEKPPESHEHVISRAGWNKLADEIRDELFGYHRQFPLRPGMPKEELKSRLRLTPKTFNLVMTRALAESVVMEQPTTYSLPDHKVTFNPQQQRQVDRLVAAFEKEPYTPPAPSELGVEPNVVAALVEQGRLTKVSESVFFLPKTFEEMLSRILAHLDQNGKITVAEARDMFGTSRKYALALMEHMDDQKITRRVGDERVKR